MIKFLLLIVFTSGYAEECPDSLLEKIYASKTLTLPEALQLTLAYQTGIKISEMDIVVREGITLQSAGPFDPLFDFEENYTYSDHFQLPLLDIASDIPQHQTNFIGSLTKRSRCGTRFSLSGHVQQTFNRLLPKVGQAISPEIQTGTVVFRVDQPLLRNFITSLDTMTEQANMVLVEASKYDWLQQTSQFLFQTILSYWEFVAAQDLLKVNIETEEHLEQIAQMTEKLIQNDQLPRTDINQPLAQIATQKVNIHLAQQAVVASLENLKLTMGIIEMQCPCFDPSLFVTSMPTLCIGISDILSLTCPLLTYASDNRYDITAAKFRGDAAELIVIGAANNELPQLDIFGAIGKKNFTTGQKARELFSPFEGGTHRPQTDYTIGVSVSIPIYNDAARGIYLQAQAQKYQAIYFYQQTIQNAVAALRTVLSNQIQLIQALTDAHESVRKNELIVLNEKKKFEAGLTSLFELITYEVELLDARALEINLKKEYLQNIAAILFQSGTLVNYDYESCSVQVAKATVLPDPFLGQGQ